MPESITVTFSPNGDRAIVRNLYHDNDEFTMPIDQWEELTTCSPEVHDGRAYITVSWRQEPLILSEWQWQELLKVIRSRVRS